MSADPPTRRPDGTFRPGTGGRPKGARGLATYILEQTTNLQDCADWCLSLWKDTEAPLEWRWKAMEWLTGRGAGAIPSVGVLQVTSAIENPRDLSVLSTEDLERIDSVFRAAYNRPMLGEKP